MSDRSQVTGTQSDELAEANESNSAAKLELLELGHRAARRFIEAERNTEVMPSPKAIADLDAFDHVGLDDPWPSAEVIKLLGSVGSAAAMGQNSGRYFGFVNGGVAPVALAAAALSTAWDQNLALPVMSPAGSRIDAAAARMIVDVLGLPSQAVATFCGGATIANLTAVITARDTLIERTGWDVHRQGLSGAPPISVIASAEAHISVLKVLRLAGIGSDAVTVVPTDDCGRLVAAELPELSPQSGPTLVLLQAGNVNTGHSDPFDAIHDHLEASGAPNTWVHVDGAFGLWANATPERRQHVAGVERADSWATDGHKWLNSPYDAGVVICADPARLHRSMASTAAYLPIEDGERSLMNLGLQMSQAARAVPIWAILASEGRDGVARAVEGCCRVAEHFADRLAAAGAEVLAPVVLNQVLVSFGDGATTDGVVEAVQRDGTCWMGATEWQGRRAMRISVSDISTTIADADASIDAVLACRERVTKQDL